MRQVHKGQKLRIKAEEFNTWQQAGQAFLDQQNSRRSNPHLNRLPDGLVLVKNSTVSNVIRFGVLGIDGPVIDPTTDATTLAGFKAHVALSGTTPATGTHESKFVITYEPILAGKIGLAWAFGVCQVQINVTDAGHEYATITNTDTTKLTSGATGEARILYKPAGTGTLWCVVAFGSGAAGTTGTQVLRVEAQANAGASATLSVREKDSSGSYVNAAFDAYNLDRGNWSTIYPDLVSGDFLFAWQTDSTWYAVPSVPSGGTGTLQLYEATADASGGSVTIEGLNYAAGSWTLDGNSQSVKVLP